MKRKWNLIWKRMGVILLGASMLCVLSSCAFIPADAGGGQSDDSFLERDEQLPAPAENGAVSYVGDYNDYGTDAPELLIRKNEDGTYLIQIGIYRVTTMEDCAGYETESGIAFTVNDWDWGNGEIRGTITVDGDVATVTFTAGWLDNGITEYKYYKTSDTPNI